MSGDSDGKKYANAAGGMTDFRSACGQRQRVSDTGHARHAHV